MSARRWPWVTSCIIGVNLALFLFFSVVDRRTEQLIAERGVTALVFYQRYRYLELKPPLSHFIGTASARSDTAASVSVSNQDSEAIGPLVAKARQAELDSKNEAFERALDRVSARSFAYVPRDNNWLGLVTYQFMHVGWLHLLGNLWFLWLTGCNIEDKWGRGLFAVFYLAAGVGAALVHKLLAIHSMVPLLGASGAIAGAMGAFCYRYSRTKIRILVLLLRFHVWQVPAYLILGLWLVTEIVSGLGSLDGGTGVAHFAHLGGFACGLGFAWLMRQTGLEQRIDERLEALRAKNQDARVLHAEALIAGGHGRDAVALLTRLYHDNPQSIDVQLVLTRAARLSGDDSLERAAKARLVELYFKNEMPDTALALYDELSVAGFRVMLPATLRMRVARHLERTGRLERANLEYAAIADDPAAHALLLSALLGQAEIAFKVGSPSEAFALFQRAERAISHQPELEGVVRLGLSRARRALSIAPRVAVPD